MRLLDIDVLRTLSTFFGVVVGIGAVLLIFYVTTSAMSRSDDPSRAKDVVGMAGIVVAMIGTLVGFVAGQAAGSMGKERTEGNVMEIATAAENRAATATRRATILGGMSDPQVVSRAAEKYENLWD